MRRARKATIYIYKWCKTAQIGGQSKDKDNKYFLCPGSSEVTS